MVISIILLYDVFIFKDDHSSTFSVLKRIYSQNFDHVMLFSTHRSLELIIHSSKEQFYRNPMVKIAVIDHYYFYDRSSKLYLKDYNILDRF